MTEGLTISNSAKVAEFESVIEGSEDIVKSKITIEDVSRETLIPLDRLKEIEVLLREKKQVIFYGPPGTSKTYVARKFAEYFAQGRENVEIVQFHQSYCI